MQHQDLTPEKLLKAELDNLKDEGCKDTDLLRDIQESISLSISREKYIILWERIREENRILFNDPQEPSDYEKIISLRSKKRTGKQPRLDKKTLEDKVYGAWLARCAGCTLGKPVEGWTRKNIKRYLEAAGAFPLQAYIPAMEKFPQGLELWENYKETTLGNITRMVRDDDIDYTVIGLKTLETYGRDFMPANVGRIWLENLPFGSIFTAEAIAYRNMVAGIDPPETAVNRNPYREFIGAQIRADMWGYVNPGDPESAAEMAYRDASVSHTKNGIYGEMWAAACIAAAFVMDDPHEIILAGLREIPAQSRLSQAIQKTMDWCDKMDSWEDVCDKIDIAYESMSSIHVINNTCLIVMGLMLGKGDLGTSLCMTLMGGMDTDCTCATAGSILGAMLGAQKLPADWITPLNDRLQSMVNGYELVDISEMAKKTLAFIPG